MPRSGWPASEQAGAPGTGRAVPGAALGTGRGGTMLVPSPDGLTVFDAATGVDWLADADLAATHRFGLAECSGASPSLASTPAAR